MTSALQSDETKGEKKLEVPYFESPDMDHKKHSINGKTDATEAQTNANLTRMNDLRLSDNVLSIDYAQDHSSNDPSRVHAAAEIEHMNYRHADTARGDYKRLFESSPSTGPKSPYLKLKNSFHTAQNTAGKEALEMGEGNLPQVSITREDALGDSRPDDDKDSSKISAYARLDFENFTFFVQTLQVILGRRSNIELMSGSHHAVDVHLGSKKAISRRHAKIFYNFGTQRFELSVIGRNGAFVDDMFVEKGITVPLLDGTKIQIGDISFAFILPSLDSQDEVLPGPGSSKSFNPSDAINLRSNLYNTSFSKSPTPKKDSHLSASPKIQHTGVLDKTKAKDSKTNLAHDIILEDEKQPARKQSTAAASSDEINELFDKIDTDNSLPVFDADTDLVNSQLNSILENDGIGDQEDLKLNSKDEVLDLSENNSLDPLDKTTNDGLESHGGSRSTKENKDLNTELSLFVLDQEIATLAPLIDAHHNDLMKRQDLLHSFDSTKSSFSDNNGYSSSKTEEWGNGAPKSYPLMGKPAAPRMGRPASIQPPASRMYNRAGVNQGLSRQNNHDRITSSSGIIGLPTHLIALENPESGLALRLAQGTPHSVTHLVTDPILKSLMHSRPPAPKLEVTVEEITHKEICPFRKKREAITLNKGVLLAPVCVPKEIDENFEPIRIPKRKKDMDQMRKAPKNVYTIEDIPEHYRTKPNVSFSFMIMNSIKSKPSENGLTLTEIYDIVKDIYPYYKYCPDGWQSPILHNLLLNKIFKRITKKDSEWTWGIDEAYIAEREKVRSKQQELAASRAKAAALKVEEMKQQQRMDTHQSALNIIGRSLPSYGLSSLGMGLQIPQSHLMNQLRQRNATDGSEGQKPKTIAELASEIRRDGIIGTKTPFYFKSDNIPNNGMALNQPAYGNRKDLTSVSSTSINTIRDQLAANRSNSSFSSPSGSQGDQTDDPQLKSQKPLNHDTKKSLTYLQKELFNLYKARKLSYNTATTTELITKALATTIAQVNAIGAKAGCGDNALSFLVEKAPQQVSKILDIALSKAIKEKQGQLSSTPNSRSATPTPSSPGTASLASGAKDRQIKPESTVKSPADLQAEATGKPSASLSKPPLFTSSLAKPPTFSSKEHTPPSASGYNSQSPGSSSLGKAPGTTKLGGLYKPPQFLTNKSSRPAFLSNKMDELNKKGFPISNDDNHSMSGRQALNAANNHYLEEPSPVGGLKRQFSSSDQNNDSEENPNKVVKID